MGKCDNCFYSPILPVPGPQGPEGPQGPQGPQGQEGGQIVYNTVSPVLNGFSGTGPVILRFQQDTVLTLGTTQLCCPIPQNTTLFVPANIPWSTDVNTDYVALS